MTRRRLTSTVGTRLLRSGRLLAILAVAADRPAARAADGPAAPEPPPVLHLSDGGFASGEIRETTRPGFLRWQATPFVAPFEFAIKDVNAVQWPPPATLSKPVGDFCFEMAAGDVLFGSLLGLDDRKAELEIPRLGKIHVQRTSLHRIYRWRDGADLIYLGPNGLTGWQEPAGQKNWREDSGQPTTDREGASIRGDFGLPARASIEFEISWKTKPDFVFALGVNDKDSTVKRSFRFEAWGGDLVVQRELEQEADLAVVQEVAAGPGRTHLQAYLDQTEGRILVFSPGGKQLADLKVAGNKPAALSGLYLANIRGDVRLEWLRIGRWNGEIPREARTDQARIHRADGSIAYGQLTGYKPESKEFLMKGDSGESRIGVDKVSSVFLSAPKDEAPRMIRAVYQDGSRVSGDLTRVEADSLGLKVPGVEEPLKLPIAGLRSLVTLARETGEVEGREHAPAGGGWRPPGRPPGGWPRGGRRELPGLAPGRQLDGQPAQARRLGQDLLQGAGRPPTRQAAQQQQQPGMGGMALRFAQALADTPSNARAARARSDGRCTSAAATSSPR